MRGSRSQKRKRMKGRRGRKRKPKACSQTGGREDRSVAMIMVE